MEKEEEEELEWFPAPPNTSATFLNQKGGLVFGGAEEDGVGGDGKISRLFSLAAASEEEESDSSHRQGKRRDRADSGANKRKTSRSPKRERRTESRERWREENRAGRRERSSVEENHTRKLSSSSAEVEYSQKPEYSGRSRIRHDSSTRSSCDGGRYENKEERERERTSDPEQSKKPESSGDQNGQRDGRNKNLPSNLLDIFNQIAQFEKEKGVKAKK